jgi:hypothetical protein
MTKVFQKWKTEIGKPIEVELKEFLGYYRKNGSLYKFKEENKEYYGECYRAKRLDDSSIIYVTIRSEVIEEFTDESNVGWAYNKNPIHDGNPYYHQDTEEEIQANKILFPRNKYNTRLLDFENRSERFEKSLIRIINSKTTPESIKLGAAKYLLFVKTPENSTRREFMTWKSNNLKEYNILSKLLNWE